MATQMQFICTQGVPLGWSSKIKWACLAVILMRAGLLIRLKTLRLRLMPLLRFGAVPSLKAAITYASFLVSKPSLESSGSMQLQFLIGIFDLLYFSFPISCRHQEQRVAHRL